MIVNRWKHVTLLLCLIAFSSHGHAQEQYNPATDTYQLGLPNFLLDSMVAQGTAVQEKDFWCWAAISQAVLGVQGIEVAQSEIVDRIMGSPHINRGATAEQVRLAADGYVHRVNGRNIRTRARHITSLHEIIQSLRDSKPLIVGFNGHIYALTAAEYRITPEGKVQISRVILRDPWPGNQSRQEWDFLNFFFHDPLIIRMDLENL